MSNVQSQMSNDKGYTLIELLIASAIMAVLSIVVFVNFKDFAQDQTLLKAQDEVQTALRLAQSNATTSTFCGTSSGVVWSTIFRTARIEIACGPADAVKRTYNLQNVEVSSVRGSECAGTSTLPVTVRYQPLSGKIAFTALDSCISTSNSLEIILKNLKNDRGKKVKVFKGGPIDVER